MALRLQGKVLRNICNAAKQRLLLTWPKPNATFGRRASHQGTVAFADGSALAR